MAEFVKVGFEFTAAPKVSKKITNPNLRLETSYYHSGQTITKRDYSESISKYKWINNEFSSDECGCEVPTPIVTSKEEVIKYYKEFMHFVKSSNLTTNIDEALNGLVLFKGYVDKEGFYVGLIMMYHATGELRAIGHYDETNRLAFDRRIGHWKFFKKEGTLYTEEIYIK